MGTDRLLIDPQHLWTGTGALFYGVKEWWFPEALCHIHFVSGRLGSRRAAKPWTVQQALSVH